jgi:putative membrane protein
MGPAMPLAHAGAHERVLAPGEAWSHWAVDPLVVIPLTVLATVYALVAAELRGTGALAARHVVSFALGWTGLAAALVSPVEALSQSLLSGHMVQHVLLVAVAVPLLAYGMPLARMQAALPRGIRARLTRLRLRAPGLGISLGALAVAALAIHTATLWAWHVPGAYEATLASGALHGVQHLAFLVTALALWWAVLAFGARTRPSGAPVAALFGLGAQGAALGALIAFATSPWYASYVEAVPVTGVDPIADQQLAGLVMWGFGGVAPVVVGAVLLVGWIQRFDRYPRAAP